MNKRIRNMKQRHIEAFKRWIRTTYIYIPTPHEVPRIDFELYTISNNDGLVVMCVDALTGFLACSVTCKARPGLFPSIRLHVYTDYNSTPPSRFGFQYIMAPGIMLDFIDSLRYIGNPNISL